ncbi:uncharacterized protein LOC116806496 [Drosophila grimshawi]|uniref:uncharacterized protein LOC116806496 n=1 Tax=Drosophila grimshawi TaxID=7222 RepID=UPI000C86FEC4|nr:uncharacterized protein LOC116806496 [Drosophila grimshawi]
MTMYYDPNDERPYMYFVKLPLIEQKFAIGCKSLRSATVGYIVDLAKDVAERTKFTYTEEPTVYCTDIGKIIVDNTALAFCISKGYGFEVFNGVQAVFKVPRHESKIIPAAINPDSYYT